ncbi:MAG TPA: TRAM domain-containing protein [Patescibacteria group bacterium]|nr:TRAM domain-containing protein [Patescibacteria group bacterium]
MEGQIVEIKIDSVGRRGDGVSAWKGHPVFVPRALPGEVVRVRLVDERDKGYSGQLVELMNPSPERVNAPCPYFDRCGGCSLQHWQPDSYRRWKVERVPMLLERSDVKVGVWKPPVFIPDHTRRRATLAAFVQNHTIRLGYHRARSHDITDISDCMILTPRLQAMVNSLRPHLVNIITDSIPADVFVQDTGLTFDVMITGAVGHRRVPTSAERAAIATMAADCNLARVSWRAGDRDEPEIIVQRSPVAKKIGRLTVNLPPGSFMQPSAEGEAALVEAALAPIREARAEKSADLFCGCGTFTGPLLNLGPVLAAESEEPSVAALKATKAKNLNVQARNLFSNPLADKDMNALDAVIFDPPRMGAKEQAGALARSPVPLVVGVSCNPSTFTRDALILQQGGYRLESMQIIDQFVWSAHMELVGIFRR